MATLSASILSSDLARLSDQVKLVEPYADVFHIDIMDARFVPPLTIGPVVVAALRPHTDRTLHDHLQVEAPESFFDELAEAGLDLASFHVEAVDDPAPVIRKARSAHLGVGIAVSPQTAVETAFPYLDEIDDVIVMSDPGYAGQSFIPESLEKVAALRNELDRHGSRADVEVDGGAKLDNAKRCLEAGATVLVAASGIFRAPDIAAAARDLALVAERGA